jgi:hypothetical protein
VAGDRTSGFGGQNPTASQALANNNNNSNIMSVEKLITYAGRIAGGLIPLAVLALWLLIGYAFFRIIKAVLQRWL